MNIAQNWRMNGQRYAMTGVKCEHCGTVQVVPRDVCPICEARRTAQYTFGQPVVIEFPAAAELRQAAR